MIPVETLKRYSETNEDIIIGADANARHIQWGSKITNDRGEFLFDFLCKTKFSIGNRGNTPTFEFPSSETSPGWSDVLDITLSKMRSLTPISNWRVSSENSFSDHRLILFEFDFSLEVKPPFRNPRNTDWEKFQTISSCKIKKIVSQFPTLGLDECADFFFQKLQCVMQGQSSSEEELSYLL